MQAKIKPEAAASGLICVKALASKKARASS